MLNWGALRDRLSLGDVWVYVGANVVSSDAKIEAARVQACLESGKEDRRADTQDRWCDPVIHSWVQKSTNSDPKEHAG